MVMTTSAVFTASAAESWGVQPASAARRMASADRSKASTSRPAFAWFAAMPPPMLPSPMNAMRMTCSLLVPVPSAERLDRRAPRRQSRSSGGLAEAVDELVGAAADGLVEDVQAVIVIGIAHRVALAVEDEAGGLDLLAQPGALDAVQAPHLAGPRPLGRRVVDDDVEPAGLQGLEHATVHLRDVHPEGRNVEIVVLLTHEHHVQRLVEGHGVQVAVDPADVVVGLD